MWCSKCHYGSEVCKLIPQGVAGVEIPSTDKEGKVTIEIVERVISKCPQCGTVSHEHLNSNPYKPKVVIAGKAKAKKKDLAKVENLKEEVASITGGDIKAMDYSKLG